VIHPPKRKKEETVPRKTKTEEIDDLVDDLDDLDEADLDEVEVDDDPDEAPKAKRSRKKAAPKKEKTGIGTREVAEAAGIEPRQLRMFLRASSYQPKDDRDGRYNWPSLNDPEVKEILKKIKAGDVEKMNKAKVAELKAKAPSKRKKVAVAADDDE
jgi:phage antirepressor YoqD-like protein